MINSRLPPDTGLPMSGLWARASIACRILDDFDRILEYQAQHQLGDGAVRVVETSDRSRLPVPDSRR